MARADDALIGQAAPAAPVAARLYFLDWLRIIALVVLMLYHVGMYYVTWRYHVKSPYASPALEPVMLLSSPWRMSLLFFVSGAAFALMLRRGASVGLLMSRAKLLLLPLLAGLLVVVMPQAYYESVQKQGFTGDFFAFARVYYGWPRQVCTAGYCHIMPTWNHLWFLPYLFVYTSFLWVMAWLWPRMAVHDARTSQEAPPTRPVGIFTTLFILLGPIVYLALVRALLGTRWRQTYALVDDWFAHAMFLGMFLLGAAMALRPLRWQVFETWRWPMLGLALSMWAVLVGFRPAVPAAPLVLATMQWGAVAAAVGFAHKWLNRDHPWRATLTEAVFPIYVLHQTLIVAFSQWMAPMRWMPAVEAPILIALTCAACWLGYEVVRRVRVLRPWFGLRSNGLRLVH